MPPDPRSSFHVKHSAGSGRPVRVPGDSRFEVEGTSTHGSRSTVHAYLGIKRELNFPFSLPDRPRACVTCSSSKVNVSRETAFGATAPRRAFWYLQRTPRAT